MGGIGGGCMCLCVCVCMPADALFFMRSYLPLHPRGLRVFNSSSYRSSGFGHKFR